MADHPVPQDVEADDKLIGPFGLRQFIYLMIVGGLVLLAVFLWQIFPLLAIIPAPFAIFLLIMALPLKKEQPMETYLAALFHFYFHSHNRWWAPGQRESTVLIEAPKKEESLAPAINPEEASNRLSFLANVIDTEGGIVNNNMNSAFLADAADTQDMFDTADRSGNLGAMLAREDQQRRDNIQQIMQSTNSTGIAQATPVNTVTPAVPNNYVPVNTPAPAAPPAAKHELTTADILSGGHTISSGDLVDDGAVSPPVSPAAPVAVAAPAMPVSVPTTPPAVNTTPVAPAPAPASAPTPASAPMPATTTTTSTPAPAASEAPPSTNTSPTPTPPVSPKTSDPAIIKAEALPEPPQDQSKNTSETKAAPKPNTSKPAPATPSARKDNENNEEVYVSLH